MFSNVTAGPLGDSLTFDIHNVDLSYINGIRRTLLSNIPVLGVRFKPQEPVNEDVHFITNTSSLDNEILGHRISMIPLCFKASEMEVYNRDDHKFVIHVENRSDEVLLVTTQDIRIYDGKGTLMPPELHRQVFPVDPVTNDPILITKLKPNPYDKSKGEALHVEFWASLGTAKEHALWSPVSQSTFRNKVDDRKADEMLHAHIKERQAAHPSTDVVQLTKDFNALQRQRYFSTNEEGEPNAFSFSLESVCGMTCEQLVHKAMVILRRSFEQLRAGAEERIRVKGEASGMDVVYIEDANHTHGHIIQAYLLRTGKGIEFVGYHMPHPLEERIIIKIRADGDVRDLVLDALDGIVRELRGLQAAWEAAVQV